MSYMSAAQMRAEIIAAKHALDDLALEYAQAHDRALSSQTTDQAHVSAGPSNQPFALVDAHTKLRTELRFASEWIRLVVHGRPARDQEPKVFGVFDQVDVLRASLARDEQRHGAAFDPVRFPRTAYQDDVQASLEAQGQRRENGDVFTGEDADARSKLGMMPLEHEFRRGIH